MPHVVRNVAFRHIEGNGLKDTTTEERRRIVRAVLQALNECERNNVIIPDQPFNKLNDKEKKRAWSLMNVHVEKIDEEMKLCHGHWWALSVTPAVTIVLAALPSHAASSLSTWSGFEEMVALQELFRVVREAKGDKAPNAQVVMLDKPYPANAMQKKPCVPEVPDTSILLNGKGAAFSDVTSHFRLTQVKHTSSKEGLSVLFLKDELNKLGLLESSSDVLKIFMKVLLQIWWSGTGTPANHKSESSDSAATISSEPQDVFPKVCPGILLASVKKRQLPACRCFAHHEEKWSLDDEDYSAERFDNDCDTLDPKQPVAFKKEQPLTVVFVTNGIGFRVKSREDNIKSLQWTELINSSVTLLDAKGTMHDSVTNSMKKVLKNLPQNVAGSIIVIAHKVRSSLFFLKIVCGPIRSTHLLVLQMFALHNFLLVPK